MELLSTRELVIDLQAGNHESLGPLYDRFNKLVFRTALGITGDPEAAADLMQEAFLRLHRFADKVDVDRPLEPWLARVTANLSYTYVRRRRWQQPIEDIAEWFAGEKKEMPHQLAETAEENQRIHKAILSLPLHQRGVVVMYYINDMSLQEISESLEVPVGTVKSRLHFGRRVLKRQLGLQGDLHPEVRYEFT